MIRVAGLGFAYPGGGRAAGGGASVLDGVDLEVAAGQLLVVLGPNGAGKSTLARIAAGLLRPSRGEALLAGRPIAAYSLAERARALAYLPQEVEVHFGFPVEEVVLMGRAPRVGRFAGEGPADLDAAARALERLDLGGLGRRRADELSGGERRRVAVARVLCQDTAALVLDEPTASLDVRHRLEVFRLLRGLCEDGGRAVLAVTHDLDAAAQYATRLAYLKEGRLVAAGPTRELLEAGLLERVFDARAALAPHPLGGGGRPLIGFALPEPEPVPEPVSENR